MKKPSDHKFPHHLELDILGIIVSADCASLYVKENIGRDFSFFAADSQKTPAVNLFFSDRNPDFSAVKRKIPLWKTGLFTVYDSGNIRLVDYNGRALSRYDFARETGSIWCPDGALMHELAYLLILSRAGEILDLRGIHRLHALGFVYRKRGGLVILPSGGGKTTLCLELMKRPSYSILSDDIPLVTSAGDLLPFPLRLGLRENSPGLERFLPVHLRLFNRRSQPPKILVDIEAWKLKIAVASKPGWVFIGSLGKEPCIRRTSLLSGFRHLAAPLLLGLGTPQIAEYVLRPHPSHIAKLARIFFLRLAACVNLLRRSRLYMFDMCIDPSRNASTLDTFISRSQKIR